MLWAKIFDLWYQREQFLYFSVRAILVINRREQIDDQGVIAHSQ